MAQAKVQEQTPVYTIVQNASVPVKHSNKPKVLILAVFLFIGFVLHNIGMFLRHGSDILVHEKQVFDFPQQYVPVVMQNYGGQNPAAYTAEAPIATETYAPAKEEEYPAAEEGLSVSGEHYSVSEEDSPTTEGEQQTSAEDQSAYMPKPESN